MTFYKNTKVKVLSPDWDTDFFDIVAGVLQGDILAPYLFIICIDYVLRTLMRENGFTLEKARKRRLPAYDIGLLENTPAKAESLLHSLEWVAGDVMCFNQRGGISILNGGSLKLVDKFTYLGSSVSSTENDVITWLAKAWTFIDRLLVIWKSDLSDKIKSIFPSSYMDAD